MNVDTEPLTMHLMPFDFDGAEKRGNYFGVNVSIAPDVVLGYRNVVHDNCVIRARTIVGDENVFSPGVLIGSPSRQRIQRQALAQGPSNTPFVSIGSRNLFEDYSSVQLPILFTTQICDEVCVGPYTHIAHDSVLRSNVTTAAHGSIGGYVTLGEGANVGMGVRIHQRCAIGAWAMLGAGAVVVRHIAPAATVAGVPAKFMCVNRVGLARAQFTSEEIIAIDSFYAGHHSLNEVPTRMRIAIHRFRKDVKAWGRAKPVIPWSDQDYQDDEMETFS